MPVPVSASHPLGLGLVAANAVELPSEGPFARLGKAKVEAPAQPKVDAPDVTMTPAETEPAPSSDAPTVVLDNLTFSYPGLDGRPVQGVPPLLNGVSLKLMPGSCCLLLGANGAGKTTLLKVIGGKHMVKESGVQVLGKPPFHDTSLTTSGDLAYVGGTWVKDVAFAGYAVPLAGDFPASKMIDSIPGVCPVRKAKLLKVLDVNPHWRMHQVSDGQRRRVQICVGLLKPYKVLLLDEITVDLDVLGRADLMHFLKEDCAERGATILYATHIFDGLESWPTHVAYMTRGEMRMFKSAGEVPELKQGRLLDMVYKLLSEERDLILKQRGPRTLEWDPSREGSVNAFSYAFNNGWTPGVLASSLKESSNAVMRQ
eukprot:gene3124-13136_t